MPAAWATGVEGGTTCEGRSAWLLGLRLTVELQEFPANRGACVGCRLCLAHAAGFVPPNALVEEEPRRIASDRRFGNDFERVAEFVSDGSHQIPVGLVRVDPR